MKVGDDKIKNVKCFNFSVVNGNIIQKTLQQKMSSVMTVINTVDSGQHREISSHSESSSESSLSDEPSARLITTSSLEMRADLFRTDIDGGQISQKSNQKAISWLITLCWSRNLSQECLWSTVLLFYALRAQKKVKKENLQLTLLACLQLAVKLTSPKALTLKELTAMTGKNISLESLIEMEALILQTFNYNIVIPHYITEVFHVDLSEDVIYVVLFICELLMLKSCYIFFEKDKIEKVIQFVIQSQTKRIPEREEIKKEIMESISLKETKIILKKYEPKFDMESFKAKLSE